jgi:hypothetical protein
VSRTQADGGGEPQAAEDPPLVPLLRAFYISDIYAAAVNGYVLREAVGLTAGQRRKLQALRLLREETIELIRAHLQDHLGVEVMEPKKAAYAGPMAAELPDPSWPSMLRLLEALSERGVSACRILRGASGEVEPRFCADLLAREIARRDFARDELDGETDGSIDRVVALLSADGQVALSRFDPAADPA